MSAEQIDWGVPDWRDASAYPKELSPTLWKWEFLRRDKDYRKDWLSYGCLPDSPKVYEALPEHREKYMLTSLPNPADPKPSNIIFWPTDVRIFYGGEDLCEINLPETHVAVVFDLGSSIAEQIKRAKAALDKMQPTQRKRGPEKSVWPNFLRILDGRATGASFIEIGKEILNNDTNSDGANVYDKYKIALEMWKSINPSHKS